MVLFFLVPYILPYFISPIFSQAPVNESQPNHVLHVDSLENKPIFLPAPNHQNDGTKLDNPDTNVDTANKERLETERQDFINHNRQENEDNIAKHETNQDDYLNNDASPNQENPNRLIESNSKRQNENYKRKAQSNENIKFRKNTYNDGTYKDKIIKKRPPTRKQMNKQIAEDGVVFVPERNYESVRSEDNEYRTINDAMNGRGTRRLYDIMEGRDIESAETEGPNQILFVSGKNNDEVKGSEPVKAEPHEDARRNSPQKTTEEPIDCTNLNCDLTTSVVCAVKKEDNKWKFRIFRNQCFLRKVNCKFSYDYNRYMLQPLDRCKHIGNDIKRAMTAQSRISPWLFTRPPTTTEAQDTRRFVYRRSLNRYNTGKTCQHVCPTSCGEEYSPQCAISENGYRRMFLNHCKLDHHSCTYNTVWSERPLAECVGMDKADLRQNRGFIGWMQRVGIVDAKGKLAIE